MDSVSHAGMAEALCGEPQLGAAKARVITGLVPCRAPGRAAGRY